MRDAVICIPTFRRPRSLARLLDAIAALKTRADIAVLVADNDAEGHAGFDLASARAAGATSARNPAASSTVIVRTSATLAPCQVISSVSGL